MDRDFSELEGKTLTMIQGDVGDEEMFFTCDNGSIYRLYHSQDCCEDVRLADICGPLDSLIGTPIIAADVVTNADGPVPEYPDSYTWTFYKLDTVKGSVTLRWLGQSNGYYSEEVSFALVKGN